MKRFKLSGLFLGAIFLTLALAGVSAATGLEPAPTVSIRSPQNYETIAAGSLDVEVYFSPCKEGKGNVRYIRLELDGAQAGVYQNEANVEDGLHTFHLDITGLDFGEHTLQAFAYQEGGAAELEGKSSAVVFIKSVVPSEPARAVKTPLANPNGIFVNVPTSVTVTAEITPDPGLIESEITLERLNALGQSAETIGYLYDDGSDGDAKAGDNIYTIKVDFKETKPAQIRLCIFARYLNEPATVSSDILKIDAVIPVSKWDFENMLNVENEAERRFNNLKSRLGDSKAQKFTIRWIERQEGVEKAGISSDNESIWILFSNGLEGGIMTHLPGTREGMPSVSAGTPPVSEPSGIGSTWLSAIVSPPSLSTGEPVVPSKVNAIVVTAYFDEFSPDDATDYIHEKLSELWAPVTFKQNVLTVDIMKTLSDYGVVSIVSHGRLNSKDEVQIYTREQATLANRPQHIFDLMTERIAIVGGYYVINPSFIRAYGGLYPRSLVYMGACFSRKNNTMSKAFLDRGAYTYFGYSRKVSCPFAYSIGRRLFGYLLDDRMTTQDAFNALGNKTDPVAPHAEFLMDGGDDLILAQRPVIIDESPTGEITNGRPQIQANIYSLSKIGIDLAAVVMTLDGSAVTPALTPRSGPWDVIISYTAADDLSDGRHTVTINAKDTAGLNAKHKEWFFTVAKPQPAKVKFISKETPHNEPWVSGTVQRSLAITCRLSKFDETANNWKIIAANFDTPFEIKLASGAKYRIDFYNTLIKDSLFLKSVTLKVNNSVPEIVEGQAQVQPAGGGYEIISLFERFKAKILTAEDKTVDEFWVYEWQDIRDMSIKTTPLTSITTGKPDDPNSGDSVIHRLHLPVPGGLQGELYINEIFSPDTTGSLSSDVLYFQEGESYFITKLNFTTHSEKGGQAWRQACVNTGVPYFTAFNVIGTACVVETYSVTGHITGFGSYDKNIDYNQKNYYNFQARVIRNAPYLNAGERRVCLGISPVTWGGRMYSPSRISPLSTDVLIEAGTVVVTCAPGKGFVGFEKGVVGE